MDCMSKLPDPSAHHLHRQCPHGLLPPQIKRHPHDQLMSEVRSSSPQQLRHVEVRRAGRGGAGRGQHGVGRRAGVSGHV